MANGLMSIGVVGAAGRLGRLILAEILDRDDVDVSFASVRPGGSDADVDIGRLIGRADLGRRTICTVEPLNGTDVVIDVSGPGLTAAAASASASAGAPFVCGVTGLCADAQSALARAAEQVPVLHARNFSIGVAILASLVRKAASMLEQYDIEIIESHHRWKQDAPSGTALLLAEAAAGGRGEPAPSYQADRSGARPERGVGFAVTRGGGVVGEHIVRFDGLHDALILEHRARDRRLFAEGAVAAARRLAVKSPGLYSIGDLFDIDMK